MIKMNNLVYISTTVVSFQHQKFYCMKHQIITKPLWKNLFLKFDGGEDIFFTFVVIYGNGKWSCSK